MSLSPQQYADAALQRWQELRGLPPEERIEILFQDFFSPPIALDCEYEATLRRVSDAIMEMS